MWKVYILLKYGPFILKKSIRILLILKKLTLALPIVKSFMVEEKKMHVEMLEI